MNDTLNLLYKALNTDDLVGNCFLRTDIENLINRYYREYIAPKCDPKTDEADEQLSLVYGILGEVRKTAFEVGFKTALKLFLL